MIIGIFPNLVKPKSESAAKKLIDLCRFYNVSYYLPADLHGMKLPLFSSVEPEHYLPRSEMRSTIDIAMSIGGDGTVIKLAKEFAGCDVSVCGVNMGSLGFLNEVEPDSLQTRFLDLMRDRYYVEERMMLHGRIVYDDGRVTDLPDALNDIVIGHANVGKMIRVEMSINDSFIQEYPADGVIISTPTGSTGYNLSSGGPIVSPNVRGLLVTPICPHLLQKVPILLDEEDELSFMARHSRNRVRISVDGMTDLDFTKKMVLHVGKSEKKAKLLRFKKNYFYETMFPKLIGKRK